MLPEMEKVSEEMPNEKKRFFASLYAMLKDYFEADKAAWDIYHQALNEAEAQEGRDLQEERLT